jgi:hypothetical protein
MGPIEPEKKIDQSNEFSPCCGGLIKFHKFGRDESSKKEGKKKKIAVSSSTPEENSWNLAVIRYDYNIPFLSLIFM